MKISILLPYKENFTPNYAGAVSLFVNDITKESVYKKSTLIYGNTIYKNYLSNNYVNLTINKKFFFSTSKQYVENFLHHEEKIKSNLIEIHNRPQYIKIIKKKYNEKLFLYFHNDPLKMSGSKSPSERTFLLNNVDKILFNSQWSRNRFFVNIKDKEKFLKKTSVCFQSSSKVRIAFEKKEKIISFVGKLNRAKGYDLFGEAIVKILAKYPSWSAYVYGDEIRENLIFKHKNLKILGFKNNEFILDELKKTSVAVVCSRWEEPFGRTSLEAASRGCAVIITNRGGLPETTNHGVVLKTLDSDSLYDKLDYLIKNNAFRKKLQIKTYKDFKYTHSFISKKIDLIRSSMNNLISKAVVTRPKLLKILHITNFNERHDGRLHYNTGKRINNGFIRLGHNVLQISDRDIISNYRNITDIKGTHTLNKKIISNYNNFKPDLIVLGHADSVLSSTLIDLKNKDKKLKICQWFLDPVIKFGPDYDRNKRRILDKVDCLDASFITTNPTSIKFKIENSFFIPNPADISFETLENYKHDCENDLFFAISHGVHRGKLKPGKEDKREKMINKLSKQNPNIKFDFYGFKQNQPIWGGDFIQKLAQSKMALNLSRGNPTKYYSSDRLAQLMGNGLLTFIDEKTCYSDFFNKKELITYSNISDLSEKINKYKKDDKTRKQIAKNGKLKYLKYFNSNLVAQFMIDKTFQINNKNRYLWY